MPNRTCPPSIRTIVTQISSPMKSFSISLRVSTSMSSVPLKADTAIPSRIEIWRHTRHDTTVDEAQ